MEAKTFYTKVFVKSEKDLPKELREENGLYKEIPICKKGGIRSACCWKKRKVSQVEYHGGYDGGTWQCKEGFGCKKERR